MPTPAVRPPERLRFADDGRIPNNPDLPALVYRGVFPRGADLADWLEALFARNGWTNAWRDGLYDYHHFHSTAHEVLGVAHGRARVRLGGDRGPTLMVRAGDVLVLPAGTGHKSESAGPGFLLVGAYADGRDWDVRRGDPAEHDAAVAAIRDVPKPAADPVQGRAGPLPRR